MLKSLFLRQNNPYCIDIRQNIDVSGRGTPNPLFYKMAAID